MLTSSSHATLYISFLTLRIKYTGQRENRVNALPLGESDTRDLALAESYGTRLEQLIANVRAGR
jgi:hypothetical protein